VILAQFQLLVLPLLLIEITTARDWLEKTTTSIHELGYLILHN